ncbi:MAG: hypothetical protein R2771_07770 [Saprospiraceae bacterium]
MNKIGIRIEDKYKLERRCPIIPEHAKLLNKEHGIEFIVQSSEKRIFSDKEFLEQGATITKDTPDSRLIIGIKEMPLDIFEEGKTYMFFSHTIKGQPYNMAELKRMVEKKINLIDYEKIRNKDGKRTIFFGRFAGLAGMINSLWSLGQKLRSEGIDNPFTMLKQARYYNSLDEALNTLQLIKNDIITNGLPDKITPLVIGITGYGHVGKGVVEILENLPIIKLEPEELHELENTNYSRNNIYISIFKENNLVEPSDNSKEFVLQDYYDNPQNYNNKFPPYIKKLSVLVTSMYWDNRYPRLITHQFLKDNYNKNFKLKCVGDITCDPGGSIEITHKCTTIEAPVFTFDPLSGNYADGFDENGITVLAVDILPSELPRESSIEFSNALLDYIPSLVNCDFDKKYEELNLHPEIKQGLILHKGEFTPEFKYMKKFIEN